MKTLEQITKQKPIFLNSWSNKLEVIMDFTDFCYNKNEDDLLNEWKDINILFASYGCANYSGDAWVLIEQDGKLLEVNGNHCSCFGLENQWQPEECNLQVLEMRLKGESFGLDDWSENNFRKELLEFLGVEENVSKDYIN
jgi:hypothetical protein